jgi:hypothetical protein
MLPTFRLGNNLSIESQPLGLSKIPPEKVDDSRSPDFPVKLAIIMSERQRVLGQGGIGSYWPAVQPQTPLPDEHMPDTHIWRLIPTAQIPRIGFLT